jgi:hypothetical protein
MPAKAGSSIVSRRSNPQGTHNPQSGVSSFVDSIESAAVRQILQKFPASEEMARNINASNWNETLFEHNKDNGVDYVTVPKNIEDFRDSLMMISILKIYEIKGWVPTLSSVEMPKAVLETKEGAFFAGFVSGSLRQQTGAIESGNTKYSRGIRAFQIFSVEKTQGRSSRHLRTGGMDSVTERLSSMKGFTQAYWGLRARLVTLFKSLKEIPVSELGTYVKSKEELLKTIKTKLHFENGGCYRPEELSYLSARYANTKNELNKFLGRLERPDEELAKNFNELYAPVKTSIETADNEIKANLSSRARILFPNDNKKRTQTWAKKSLSEKLSDLSEDKLKEFLPETLPGIIAMPIQVEGSPQRRISLLGQRYPTEDNLIREVIASWYANFDESEED